MRYRLLKTRGPQSLPLPNFCESKSQEPLLSPNHTPTPTHAHTHTRTHAHTHTHTHTHLRCSPNFVLSFQGGVVWGALLSLVGGRFSGTCFSKEHSLRSPPVRPHPLKRGKERGLQAMFCSTLAESSFEGGSSSPSNENTTLEFPRMAQLVWSAIDFAEMATDVTLSQLGFRGNQRGTNLLMGCLHFTMAIWILFSLLAAPAFDVHRVRGLHA